jgi:D-glycero-D-manno-heptose 1,7-bisphosphate phosphatase
VELDGAYYCHHHPDFGGRCDCRKPAPGLLLDAARDLGIELAASWMIGDADSDVIAAHAAGAKAVLVAHPRTAHRRGGTVAPEHAAPDLAAAAALIAR